MMKERIINKLNLTRRLRQFLVLFTFALLPMGAWAEDYNLWIDGTQVTSANASSLANGTVSFTPSDGTNPAKLTLNDARLNKIRTGIPNLVIELVGTNDITSNDGAAIENTTATTLTLTFKGDGFLKMRPQDDTNPSISGLTPSYTGMLTLGSYNTNGKPFAVAKQILGGGSGTDTDPFLIGCPTSENNWRNDLDNFRIYVNIGLVDGQYFKVDNSYSYIDWPSATPPIPIGTIDHPFNGVFDGAKIPITLNVTLNSETGYNGLFGVVTGGTLRQVKLANCTFSKGDCVGAIVGCLRGGLIEDCVVSSCTMTSGNAQNVTVGGIAGKVQLGTIQNCEVYPSSINGTTTYSTDEGFSYTGGIVGFIDGSGEVSILSNKVLKGNINSSTTIQGSHAKPHGICVGGIVGNCAHATADIQIRGNRVKDDTAIKGVNGSTSDLDYFFVGAIVGQAESAVFQNNYYDYTVTTSTKNGTVPEVGLSGYTHRGTGAVQGVGNDIDIFANDGIVLYNTYKLSLPFNMGLANYSGTSGTYYRAESTKNGVTCNDIYVLAGSTASVTVSPQGGYTPLGYLVTYTPQGGSTTTIQATQTPGSYIYTFTMPEADASFYEGTSYNIKIGGVLLTSGNENTGAFAGVSYDNQAKRMTLTNVNLTGPITFLEDHLELTIILDGSNSITTTGSNSPCIVGSGSNQSIEFIKNDGYDDDLTLECDANCNFISGFTNADNPPLTGVRMVSEEPASGQPRRASIECVYFTIGGLEVSKSNADDIKGATITGTKVSFDMQSKTLTLNNATVQGYVDWSLKSSGPSSNENLTVKLIGKNSIICQERAFVSDEEAAQLVFTTTEADDGSLTMQRTNSGNPFINEYQRNFNNVVCADGSNLTIASKPMTSNIVIVSFPYGISVDGTPFTSAFTDYNGDGRIRYVHDAVNHTGTLTLRNAQVMKGIFTTLANLTIHVEKGSGNYSWITSPHGNCIASSANTGTLTFTKEDGAKLELYTNLSSSHYSVIRGFKKLEGVPLETQEPYEIYDDGYYRLKDKLATDTTALQYAVIEADETYPLWFCSTQLTSKGVNSGSGTATYDATTNTMTLTDGFEVVVEGSDTNPYYGIINEISNLKVFLSGSSSIMCKGPEDVAIKGNGTGITFTTDANNPGSISLLAKKSQEGNWFQECSPVYQNGLMCVNGAKNTTFDLFTCTVGRFFEGAGTESSPFLISSVNDLDRLAEYVRTGTLTTQHFRLTDNLSFSQVPNFSPIGEYSGSPFVGTFDGDNHIISGLSYVQAATQWAIGLFGYIGEEPGNNSVAGTVKNLVLENCEFGSGDDVGAIAYCLRNGTIDNCTVKSCTVTGGDAQDAIAGGIAGTVNSGTISNCTVNGTTSVGAYTAGAIYGSTVANGSAPTLSNNYYYYTVQVTDGNGLKKDYAERGIGEQADGDGALLYTRPVSVSGLSKADGDGWEVVNFYALNNGVYSLAPGTTASLEITPRADYIPTTVSLAYGSQTDNLDNTSTTGGYTYGFEVPDAEATVNVAMAVDLTSTSFTYEIAGTDYNGTAVVPATVTMKKAGTAVTPFTKDTHFTIEGYKDSNSNALSGAPTDAGTYFATIQGVLAGGYVGTKDVQFVINKASNAFTTAPVGAANLTYNGGEQALITTAGTAGFGDVVYSLTADGAFGAANTIKATDAKTYTIYYKVEGTNNYDGIAASSIQVAIAQAAISSVTLDKTELVYQLNTQQTVTVTKVMAGTLEVSADYYTVSGNTGTDEGSYTLVVTARTDIANNFKGSASATWTITKHVATETELGFATTTQDYASFYSETEDLYLPDGFVAYIVTATDDTSVTTQRISYVPKGVAVLIERGSSTETAIDQPTGNMLHGTTVPTNVADISGGTVYVLYNGEFVRCTEGTIPAGRCYLLVPSGSNARRLTIGHGDDTTGVQYYRTYSDMNGEQWYDMQGRKIDKPTKAGLYILNGRKVVVRNHQVVNNK